MKQKMFKYITITVSLFVTFVIDANAQIKDNQKIRTVVIDPGHGGEDPGCVGKFSKEKDIVLKISMLFGDYIKSNFSNIKVVYTRTDDSHVELYKRAEIANKNNADLFISVHVNSFRSSEPYGTETFVMGHSKSSANLEVAKLENSAILKEANYESNYDGFDPNDPENHIIFSLYQNANLVQSLLFAQYTQENFKNTLDRFDRGVKQAGFLVLWKTTMPSVLVELGFLSNPHEEKYLNSEKGQEELAKAMFNAFSKYRERYQGEMPDNTKDKIAEEQKTEETENKSDVNNVITETKISTDAIVYKIQIHSSNEKIELIPRNFKSYENVGLYLHNGLYKYTIGEETDIEKIEELLKKVKKDYKEAFIIKFKNNERIL
jgi:N-acetylmuramoyl-L-alanine amidase